MARSARLAGPVSIAIAILSVATASFGQASPAKPASFAVASIKPDKTNAPVTFGVGNGQGGGRNVTLKTLIALAYQVQEFQISGGPGWIGAERFDVEGKADDPNASPAQLRLMLQALLQERFELRLRSESREAPVYALVIANGGPKIKLVADQTTPSVNGPAQPGAGPNRGAMRIGRGSLIGNAVTLPLFARLLSQRLDRPVIDRTHLSDRFDIQLTWTPDIGETSLDPGGTTLPAADPGGPSLFTAIQEQLGLKLEPAKAPVDLLIVEQAQKPSAN